MHSQAEAEQADLSRERLEPAAGPAAEERERTALHVARGLQPQLAPQVARQLMAQDAFAAIARADLGISEDFRARPLTAASASVASFSVGALLPLVVTALTTAHGRIAWVSGSSLFFLAARAGGASVATGASRVTFCGALSPLQPGTFRADGGDSAFASSDTAERLRSRAAMKTASVWRGAFIGSAW